MRKLSGKGKKMLERRKNRYRQDDEYRTKTQVRARRVYRRNNGVLLKNCLYSLKFLDEAAKLRPVILPNKKTGFAPALSIPETATIMQKLYQTVWRWVDIGFLPKPILRSCNRPNNSSLLYHKEEVRIFIEEIGKHEKELAYLRRDHVFVRDCIAQRVLTFRQQCALTS